MTTITTDLDLSELAKAYGTLLPAQVMRDVGMKYRIYRHNAIMQGKQLHDLSPMPPLKPETIKRKSGAHGGMGRSYGKLSAKGQNFRRLKSGSIKQGARGRISMHPAIALVDTGNMAAQNALNIETAPGLLILSQGTTRAEIAGYHQAGNENLPQRVHISWNPEFIQREAMPVIMAHYNTAIQKARRRTVA